MTPARRWSPREVADAIIALEACANAEEDPSADGVYRDGGWLATKAWTMVRGGRVATGALLRSDALEAAAMLRDGYLPGHDAWLTRIDYEAVL